MLIGKIKKSVDTAIAGLSSRYRSRKQALYDHEHIKYYLASGNKLTREERNAIDDKWKKVFNNTKIGYEFFQGLKPLFGFDPDFLPSSFFYPRIEGILNPKEWKYKLSHKGMLEMLYNSGIRHPKTILRSFGGVILDDDYNPLTLTKALDKIRKIDSDLLYKPATDSEQGFGIVKYPADSLSLLYKRLSDGELLRSGDFVLQELVAQSEQTSIFNESSLNCVRVTTLNLNGEISVCSLALKCGPKDSVVDNIGSGRRGVIVGLNETGELNPVGFYGNGEPAKSHNQVTFEGKKISDLPKIVKTAVELHEYCPGCKIIGWDIALDINDEPVLIEGNTVYPGISLEQMCSGPIFGDRTNEVIDYLIYMIRGGEL